jgi:mannose-6-phosphate isomerase-like protein (cupin superfamily)
MFASMTKAIRQVATRTFVVVSVLAVGTLATVSVGHAGARVNYIPAAEVKAGFETGAVLLNNGHYQVHASRREEPGQVEVHVKDTDVIYMLEGTTTFVTGGTIVNGATTAADEIRGSDVQGGETRTLTKGDVIVVPNGTPHWFKEVKGPVLYYVVKVQ